MYSLEHLHFRNGRFHLKYNEKVVRYYPPNFIYDYVRNSKNYPLELELIDLPAVYQVEYINSTKSIAELEELLTLANHVNIFTKLKFMR